MTSRRLARFSGADDLLEVGGRDRGWLLVGPGEQVLVSAHDVVGVVVAGDCDEVVIVDIACRGGDRCRIGDDVGQRFDGGEVVDCGGQVDLAAQTWPGGEHFAHFGHEDVADDDFECVSLQPGLYDAV